MILTEMPFSEGALYSLLSIIMVFAILLIIIGITTLVFKLLGLFEYKSKVDSLKKQSIDNNSQLNNPNKNKNNTIIEDDDMMAAVLVATIDYQNEIKQDVRLVNVRKL